MAILTNDIDTRELGSGRPALRLAAGIGYNSQLYRGGLWALQTQAVGSIGSGNAQITIIARGTTSQVVSVTLQAASQPLTHVYTGGLLNIRPATDGATAPISTAAQIVAYLRAQAGLVDDFAAFIAGGDGTGILPAPTTGINFLLGGLRQNYWIPASQSGVGILTYARGDTPGIYASNLGGLPGANGTATNPAHRGATGERGIHRWQNDVGGSPLASAWQDAYAVDDTLVSASSGSGRGRVGRVVFVDPSGLYVEVDESL